MNNNSYENPYPYKKVAFAVAFSPRLDAILSEAYRLYQVFNCELLFIHVGDKNTQKEKELEKKLAENKLPAQKREVIWEDGSPGNKLLDVCHEEEVDLLVLGALQRESLLSYYIGSVARKVCRKGDFSILLLTEPRSRPAPLEKIVVSAPEHPKTPVTLSTALHWGQEFKSKELFVVRESTLYGFGKMISEDTMEEEEKFKEEFMKTENESLNRVLKQLNCQEDIQIKTEIVTGKPGYEIAKFAKNKNADLLVVNSPDSRLGIMDRFFPHDLEHVLADLPCSLLIVHPVEKEN